MAETHSWPEPTWWRHSRCAPACSLSHAGELDAALARFDSRIRAAAASLDVADVETLLTTTAIEAERLARNQSSHMEER